MDLQSLFEHSLLTKTGANEYTLQAGDDFTEAAIYLEGLGWKPRSHVAGEDIRTVVYAPVGIPDAYERLRKDITLTYKVLHSGKLLQARSSAKKTFGWPVQFELYDITDQERTKVAHFVRRYYLNREDVATVFLTDGIQEVLPQEREETEAFSAMQQFDDED